MKKLRRVLLVSGLALFLLFINFSIDTNSSSDYKVSLDFMGTKAVAQTNPGVEDDCNDNGFRKWNAANPLLSSGKDCWCEDRNRVKEDCKTS